MRHLLLQAALTSTIGLAAFCLATGSLAQSTEQDAAENAASDEIPDVYFVPMRGQMGTDVHPTIYKDVVKDILAKKPDLIVYELNCADVNNIFYLNDDDPQEASQFMLGEYRDLVKMLREDLRDIPQVMWVHDSVGFGSLMALAWPDMYMTSDARLSGLGKVLAPVMSWRDPDVRAKMLAAWTGIGKGFIDQGGYDLVIGEAMMRPEKSLSCSFVGREVTWRPDNEGTWIIDDDPKRTATFTAQLAEDVGLCDGIADTRDDLMFLLGYREYREVADSGAIVDRYIESWRRAYEQCFTWAEEYQDALGWARGEEAVKYLGQAKERLERILSQMIKYPAVEHRIRAATGITRTFVEIQIEQLREQIRALRSGGRNQGLGGGGGASSGGGGGRRR